MAQSRYRYPGVQPFKPSENDIFFGRERDQEDLLDLILLEKVVVLFGKSGYGKSSLINAGILPFLEDIIPVIIRFGNYTAEKQASPLTITSQKIEETLSKSIDADFLQKLNLAPSLWLTLKHTQALRQKRFLFVFDQFEEFFTYPIDEQYVFKEQLADVLYTKLPQSIRDRTETLDEKELDFVANPFEAHALFSIRWDRLGLLDSLKDKLPAILHKRYELKGLTRSQAREGIERPANAEKGNFKTERFTYSEEALTTILDELTKASNTSQGGVAEAFQLQIICQSIESKVERDTLNQITVKDLPDLSGIYENYYNRQIETLDSDLRSPAQQIIEDALIDEQDARRISVDTLTLLRKPGVTLELLDKLENTFLIRRENNTVGGFSYEVAHDTLIAPILKSKELRRIEQKRILIERERIAEEKMQELTRLINEKKLKEAELLAEKEKAAAERERTRNEQLEKALIDAETNQKKADRNAMRAKGWLYATVIALVLAIGVIIWALTERASANSARETADNSQKRAETNLLRFQETQFNSFLIDAKTFGSSTDEAEKKMALKLADSIRLEIAKIDSAKGKALLTELEQIKNPLLKP